MRRKVVITGLYLPVLVSIGWILLAVALSKPGLHKVKEIMEGDEVLRAGASGCTGRLMCGRDQYLWPSSACLAVFW